MATFPDLVIDVDVDVGPNNLNIRGSLHIRQVVKEKQSNGNTVHEQVSGMVANKASIQCCCTFNAVSIMAPQQIGTYLDCAPRTKPR